MAIASLSIEFYSDSLPRRERREGRKPWHGIIPRDFRSEYSLAGHSFQSVTFAMAKRVEQFLLSLDDRGPRRHDNKVSTFTDPGLVSDHRFRVMYRANNYAPVYSFDSIAVDRVFLTMMIC